MSKQHIEINGKIYPLWEQFVINKNEWIGGILRDYGGGCMGSDYYEGIITNIILDPNGEEDAFFSVESNDFGCGFSVKVGGFVGKPDGLNGDIFFSGYCGHTWSIEKKKKENEVKK